MRAIQAILVALVATIILTSVAAAGPDAAKQRVAIDMKICRPGKSQGTFVLTPLQVGPLKADSGTISHNFLSIPGRDVVRDGQKVTIYDGGVATLTGKRGTLTIRDRNEWVGLGNDANRDGEKTASPSVPGRSCAGPASTPGSSARGGVAMQASDARGMHATRAS